MQNSPTHSPPNPGFALLGFAMGVYLAIGGVKIIIRRETTIGRRGGPFNTVYGKEAVYAGLFFVALGLFFIIFGILSVAKFYNLF